MSSYPSFIYDQFRPGMETEADAVVWRTNRERLEHIMHGLAKEIGARVCRSGLGGAETADTKGKATIMELDRQEPPMTADEAREFGKGVVTGWTAVKLVEAVPDFCDMVFPLPSPRE